MFWAGCYVLRPFYLEQFGQPISSYRNFLPYSLKASYSFKLFQYISNSKNKGLIWPNNLNRYGWPKDLGNEVVR